MGTYLSKPSTTVNVESGEGPQNIKYAVGEMQGWRKQMEDTHIAVTDLNAILIRQTFSSSSPSASVLMDVTGADEMFRFSSDDNSVDMSPVSPSNSLLEEQMALFGVFDGHGGKDVAKFVQKMYTSELIKIPEFLSGNFEDALRKSFHRIDELLEDPKYDKILQEFRAIPNPSDTVDRDLVHDRDNGTVIDRIDIMAAALAVASSPANKNKSPTNKKFELASKLLKQIAHEKQRQKESPTASPSHAIAAAKVNPIPYAYDDMLVGTTPAEAPLRVERLISQDDIDVDKDMMPDMSTLAIDLIAGSADIDVMSQELSPNVSTSRSLILSSTSTTIMVKDEDNSSKTIDDGIPKDVKNQVLEESGTGIIECEDDTKPAAVIVGEILESTIMESMDDSHWEPILSKSSSLSRNGSMIPSPSSSLSYNRSSSGASSTSAAITAAISMNPGQRFDSKLLPRTPPRANGRKPVPNPATKPNASSDLKPHRVPSGCTAIVAFKYGMKLYVANAGDSRAVLCRAGGCALALSDDHKPLQQRELSRIMSAGGFVTKEGRINGNLNLSRSLGDLKYKQGESLGKENQMITAEPDIRVVDMLPDDRFLLLACDGVWDCMANQQACDFISQRLDQGLSERDIVVQLCHRCLAEDSVKGLGIGTDNMTCVLVLLR